MPKISVIVPIYKVEKYLDMCVESILTQTFADFELILVDDGSPDSCPAKCDEWAEKDDRIKVIHKINGGIINARTAGAEVAKGEYILYVDGDDAASEDMLSVLYANAEKYGADIVQCGASVIYEDGVSAGMPTIVKTRQRFFSSEELKNEWLLRFVRDGIYPEGIDCYVWNKLYKAEIVRKTIPYLTSKISMREDALFNLWAYSFAANKLELQGQPLYLYTHRNGSLSHKFDRGNIIELDLFTEEIRSVCAEFDYPCSGLNKIRDHALVGHLVHCIVDNYSAKRKADDIRTLHREMSSNSQILFEAKRSGGILGVLLRLVQVRLYMPAAILSEAGHAVRRLIK